MSTDLKRPTGNGTTANWSSSSGGNVWADVDETSADDDTTYAFRDDSFAVHQFTYTAFAITSSAIASIKIYHRARSTTGGTLADYTGGIVVTATNRFGAVQNDTVNTYADFTDTWTTNPATGAAWTEADVEGTGTNPLTGMLVRASSMVPGERMRCTQISIEVDYTAAAGGTSITPTVGAATLTGIAGRMDFGIFVPTQVDP